MKRAAERYQWIQDNKRLVIELDSANQILGKENIDLKKEVEKQYSFKKIIGNSTGLAKVLDLVKKIIPTNTTVLISGETGTGKELIARAIHFNGPRKNKVFLAQNCAALPDTLLESELFGHKRGAFTDAVEDKKGLFELADGGTIFLDEIADTSLAFQQRLLRVLQEGELQALGSTKPKKVDVRIISAVNQNLEKAVHDGQFREDLYYRINVFPIHILPLRERIDDIPLLVEYFISKYALQNNKNIIGVSKAALQVLMQHEFPGNVRELENLIERAVVLSDTDTLIDPSVFNLTENSILQTVRPNTLATPLTLREMTESLERQTILRSLKNNNGNISKTALELGLSRVGLYKKIKRYNLG